MLLRRYLKQTRFMMQSNHEVLRWILTVTKATGKMERRWYRLSELELDIVYVADVKHQTVNALPRLNTKAYDRTPLADGASVLGISRNPLPVRPLW